MTQKKLMTPKIELLSDELIQKVLDEAFQLLLSPGVKISSAEARQMLGDAGAVIEDDDEIVKIPELLVRKALETAPSQFLLFDLKGRAVVEYGGNRVHFDPGSSGVNILDPVTLEHRPAKTDDLIRLVKVTETLSQYDAQSTAVICNEVPKEIGDIYRLYLVLLHSSKPIVTGAFSVNTLRPMLQMLAIPAGGMAELKQKPIAVFDVCPTPPLVWTEFGAKNLIELAREGVPAQIVSMPLAGVAGPVTLLGSIVQHAAECLSGITLHQLAQPGSPVVWGGAPAIFDMRYGTTPMGAIETAMIDAAYAQVGKSLKIPTHTYLGASDAKLVDAQAGLESGMSMLLGALAGINMISGAGMLDFLACQSPEKLAMDAEVIAMVKRLLEGMKIQTEPLASDMFVGIDFKADFLKQKITRQLFREEQHLPSSIVDRETHRSWDAGGRRSSFMRAKQRVDELVSLYKPPEIQPEVYREIKSRMLALAQSAGMDTLPSISDN